jgi:hypothetical protein
LHRNPVILDRAWGKSALGLQVRTEAIHYSFLFCLEWCWLFGNQTLLGENIEELTERLRITFSYLAVTSGVSITCWR